MAAFTENRRTLPLWLILYIEGNDVSPFLPVGSAVSLETAGTAGIGSLSFTLSNPNNLFTITEANACGKWSDRERIKRNLFATRKALNRSRTGSVSQDEIDTLLADDELLATQRADERGRIETRDRDISGEDNVDRRTGMPPYHLVPDTTIFSVHDSVRLFGRDPSNLNRWMPLYTGFINSVSRGDSALDGSSTIDITCYDFKGLLNRMRVRMNPGPQGVGTAADLQDLTAQLDQSEAGVFADLRGSSNYTHPLAGRTLRESVAYLLAGDIRDEPEKQEQQLKQIGEQFKDLDQKLTAKTTDRRRLESLSPQDPRFQPPNRSKADQLKRLDSEITWLDTQRQRAVALTQRRVGETVDRALTGVGERVNRFAALVAFSGVETPSRSAGVATKKNAGRIQRGWAADKLATRTMPTNLAEWHNLTLYGRLKPVEDDDLVFTGWYGRPMTLAEVVAVGTETRTFVRTTYSPLSSAVHLLLPGDRQASRALVEMAYTDYASTTIEFSTRWELLQEVCQPSFYHVTVSPVGDIIVEPPLYDSDPTDFAQYAPSFTLDRHITDTPITDDSLDVPTVLVVTGGENAIVGGSALIPAEVINSNYRVVIQCPTLLKRMGASVEQISAPHIGGQIEAGERAATIRQLRNFGMLHLIRRIGEATALSASMPVRPTLHLNRPLHHRGVDRIGLVTDLSHSWSIGGQAQSSAVVSFCRMRDNDGTYRYVTGDERMPVSYAREYTGAGALQMSGIVTSDSSEDGTGEPGTRGEIPSLSFGGTRSFGAVRRASGRYAKRGAVKIIHFGTDYYVPCYTAVYAPFDGIIVQFIYDRRMYTGDDLALLKHVAPGARPGGAAGFGMFLVLRGVVRGKIADLWCGHIWGTSDRLKAGGPLRNRRTGEPPIGTRGPGRVATDTNGMEIGRGSAVRAGDLLCFVGVRGARAPHLHAELALVAPSADDREQADRTIQESMERAGGAELFDEKRRVSRRMRPTGLTTDGLADAERELGLDVGSSNTRLSTGGRVTYGGWRVDPREWISDADLFGAPIEAPAVPERDATKVPASVRPVGNQARCADNGTIDQTASGNAAPRDRRIKRVVPHGRGIR